MSWLSSLFRRKPSSPTLWTGKVLSQHEFKQSLRTWETGGDMTYAEVNSSALDGYYDWFKSKLFDLGVTNWDERQDCDDFANLYADFLQLKFYLAQWQPGTMPDAEALAVARYWYRPGATSNGHAINAVATEKGILFIEPQTGKRLQLSDNERLTVLRCIF